MRLSEHETQRSRKTCCVANTCCIFICLVRLLKGFPFAGKYGHQTRVDTFTIYWPCFFVCVVECHHKSRYRNMRTSTLTGMCYTIPYPSDEHVNGIVSMLVSCMCGGGISCDDRICIIQMEMSCSDWHSTFGHVSHGDGVTVQVVHLCYKAPRRLHLSDRSSHELDPLTATIYENFFKRSNDIITVIAAPL